MILTRRLIASSSKRNVLFNQTPSTQFYSRLKQQQQQEQQHYKPIFLKRGVRVALIIQDLQNNIILLQKKQKIINGEEEEVFAQVPSISLSNNTMRKTFEDPREALTEYMREELLLQPDDDTVTPFSSFYTNPEYTDEQTLVYYCKILRYYESDEQHDLKQEYLRHVTIDEVNRALGNNLLNSGEDENNKKSLIIRDSISTSALGKFMIDRSEHIANAREYYIKIRYGAVGLVVGAGVMMFVLGTIATN
jgi:hypothetical protein